MPAPHRPGLPEHIRFTPIESEEFLDDFAIRHIWTPFEGACLLRRLNPIRVENATAIVGIPCDHTDNLDEFPSSDTECEADILNLTRSISQRWKWDHPTAAEIIEWGIGKGIVRDTSFSRRVLGRVPHAEHQDEVERLHKIIEDLRTQLAHTSDGRGKHHDEKRLAILGFAIKELALNLDEGKLGTEHLLRGGSVNASALAKHLDSQRTELHIPPEEGKSGFGFRNLEAVLRSAISAADEFAKRLPADKK